MVFYVKLQVEYPLRQASCLVHPVTRVFLRHPTSSLSHPLLKMSEASQKMDDIKPGDSVSQCESTSSSKASSRARLRVIARKATIAAEAAALQEKHELELEELRLKQRRLELEMRTKLKVAEAEEEVYTLYDELLKSTTKAPVVSPPVIPAAPQLDDTIPYPR